MDLLAHTQEYKCRDFCWLLMSKSHVAVADEDSRVNVIPKLGRQVEEACSALVCCFAVWNP